MGRGSQWRMPMDNLSHAGIFRLMLCCIDIKWWNQLKLEAHSYSMERTTRRLQSAYFE